MGIASSVGLSPVTACGCFPWNSTAAIFAGSPGRTGVGSLRGCCVVPITASNGAVLFRYACGMGLEGIVAKRRDRPYQSGRCADWVKVINPEAHAVTRLTDEAP